MFVCGHCEMKLTGAEIFPCSTGSFAIVPPLLLRKRGIPIATSPSALPVRALVCSYLRMEASPIGATCMVQCCCFVSFHALFHPIACLTLWDRRESNSQSKPNQLGSTWEAPFLTVRNVAMPQSCAFRRDGIDVSSTFKARAGIGGGSEDAKTKC